ncbi:MFS transporter [Silvibacterium acidisoli]|uniref:MFS transporter n=1 Tax=Acidobacteriaceae bacterium ZG23-2 TaxID=2883246 RepID=UPI00406D2865
MKSRYAWFLVGMLWLVCFCNYADRQSIFSLFPQIRQQMNLNDLQLGIIASSFMWVYAISGPIAGWISDRVSPRSVVLWALAFWSVVTAATGYARGYSSLVVFRTLGGFSEAFYFPAAMTLIALYHGPKTRSRAMAIHQSSVYAGTVAGGSIAGYVAEQHGWRASFLFLGIFGILLGIALAALMKTPPRTDHEQSSSKSFVMDLIHILGISESNAIIATFIGANFVAMVFLTWLPTFLFTKFKMNLGQAGISSTAYLQTASVIGVLLGGYLGDRATAWSSGGRQIVQACGLFLGAPFLFLVGSTSSLKGLVIGLLGLGLSKGVYDANMWASLYDVVPAENRGVAAGTMNSLGWLGGGIAPVAIAIGARRFGMGPCISATSAIYLLLAIGTLKLGIHMSKQLC